MHMPSAPLNEKERLAALREYQVLDTEAETEYDEVASLASEICQVPTAVITLIDHNRTWIKASANFPVHELPGGTILLEQAILSPHDPLVVSDMRQDERFKDLPFVKEDPQFVFISSVPLINPKGFVLGTLCVLDKQPRKLSESQLRTLQILAAQIVHLLELRKASLLIKSLRSDLELQDSEFQQFAYSISHDIKSPLASIILTSEMFRENFGDHLDEDNDQLLKVLSRSSLKILSLVDGVLAYYRSGQALAASPEPFSLKPLLLSIAEMFDTKQKVDFQLPEQDHCILMNKTALEQIFINLIQNAVKYTDKNKPGIQIRFTESDDNYHFIVADNGRGITLEEQKKLTELLATTDQRDRFDTRGTGIGLFIVKRLVEKLSGTIQMKTTPGEGSEFSFSVKKQ
jgi:hypothetical protein